MSPLCINKRDRETSNIVPGALRPPQLILGEGFEYPVLDIIEKFAAQSSSRGLLKCSDAKRYTATTKRLLVLLAAGFIRISIFTKANLFAISAFSVRQFYENTLAFKCILALWIRNRIQNFNIFSCSCLSIHSFYPFPRSSFTNRSLWDIFQCHANTKV